MCVGGLGCRGRRLLKGSRGILGGRLFFGGGFEVEVDGLGGWW